MGSLKILLSALVLSGISAQASAADLLPPPPPLPSEGSVVSELGTGWYLRGDVGYVDYANPREALGYSAGLPFDSIRLANTWSGGAPAGRAQAAARASASTTSSTTWLTSSRLSPSPMTRITGSVPEGRITSRP